MTWMPQGHFGEPEDVANLVGFLAEEKANYITGQVICVDGEWPSENSRIVKYATALGSTMQEIVIYSPA